MKNCFPAKRPRPPSRWENDIRKTIWRTIKGPIILFGAMVEYHPISARDQSRFDQFGKKGLPVFFLEVLTPQRSENLIFYRRWYSKTVRKRDENVGLLRRGARTTCTRRHMLCRASPCLEKQSSASLSAASASYPAPPVWVVWSASLGECRFRSLMVSVNELTPSETACTETRVLSASLKSPKRIPSLRCSSRWKGSIFWSFKNFLSFSFLFLLISLLFFPFTSLSFNTQSACDHLVSSMQFLSVPSFFSTRCHIFPSLPVFFSDLVFPSSARGLPSSVMSC